jgi:hypothetical protein
VDQDPGSGAVATKTDISLGSIPQALTQAFVVVEGKVAVQASEDGLCRRWASRPRIATVDGVWYAVVAPPLPSWPISGKAF